MTRFEGSFGALAVKGDVSRGEYEASETFGRDPTLTRSILVCLAPSDSRYLASVGLASSLAPEGVCWSTLRVDASRRRRRCLRESIVPTAHMLGGGRTIAGAVVRCNSIPFPILAVSTSRKRAVHSDGSPEVQNARERTRRGSDELK